jgi:hypothetical protein
MVALTIRRPDNTLTAVPGQHANVDDVRAAWQEWANAFGLPARGRTGDFSTDLRRSRKVATVHISAGNWVADCPGCNGGVPGWPGHEDGCCLDCGTIWKLDYPPADEISELVELLAVRPPEQRNYFPHKGETIEFVRRENALYKFAETRDDQATIRIATVRDILGDKAVAKLQQQGVI